MAETEKKTYKWNPECLVPETATVDLGKDLDPGGPFEFRELPRTDLLSFIDHCVNNKFTNEAGDRLPFLEIYKKQEAMINDYLSRSTGKKGDPNFRPVKFFETLEVPPRVYGDFLELLYQINHLEEILGTGGNLLMLPTLREVMRKDQATEAPAAE